MRADAKRNYDQVLAAAHNAFAELGSDVSIREIARRAGVGKATLLRHFPTREALFEALLCASMDALNQKAINLEKAPSPDKSLIAWFREWITFARSYKGVVALMAAAHSNPDSALYASCAAVHSASSRLLQRAQTEGSARADLNGDELFALMAALGWAIDQPTMTPMSDRLFEILESAILTSDKKC